MAVHLSKMAAMMIGTKEFDHQFERNKILLQNGKRIFLGRANFGGWVGAQHTKIFLRMAYMLKVSLEKLP